MTDHLEPILIPDDDRFVVLPVKYQDLYQMYKSAVACFWTAEEVDLSKDLGDWAKMTADEKHFILLIPTLFACVDRLIYELNTYEITYSLT